MALPQTTHDQGLPTKVDTRLDLLTDQKIKCYNCNDLGHFANKCQKSKQIKKDKDYLELEAKYQALLKKHARKGIHSRRKVLG